MANPRTDRSDSPSAFIDSESASCQVNLLWCRRGRTLYALLSLNVAREVCDYIRERTVLIEARKNYLIIHRSPHLCESFHLAKSSLGGTFVLISRLEALYLELNSTEVFSLNLSTIEINTEEPMSQRRLNPGVIRVSKVVYVFGGLHTGEGSKTAECFDTVARSWRSLPDMDSGRAWFSPALFQRDIILAGRQVAFFHIDSATYTVVLARLPVSPTASLSFVVGGVYFLCNSTEAWRWRLTARDEHSVIRAKGPQGLACSEIVVSGGKAYWVQFAGSGLKKTDIPRGQ